ncbi:NAD(P)H-dependent oxidoreductase [Sphingomonas sp. IW22]|uniref:NAD(P)H-dependent oxidoreductase n=1 Tax=Sphingomonas sp. IW22 TaxID=3242489 RepID=UPI003520C2E4
MAAAERAGPPANEPRAATGPIVHHVVVGHPNPASFCRSMARTYCEAVVANGQVGDLHDLYMHSFDPLLRVEERPGPAYRLHADVAAELDRVQRSDVLVLAFPIWFGLPPAIIKGYVDRILGAGFVTSTLSEHRPSPVLKGKRLVILSSSGTTRPWLEERGQYSGLRHAFDLYLTEIFGMTGPDRMHFDGIVPDARPDYIDQCLEDVRQRTNAICADLLRLRHAERAREAMRRQGGRQP